MYRTYGYLFLTKLLGLHLIWSTRSPYTNCIIITRRSQHSWSTRVPAYTVHSHGMPGQNLKWPGISSAPNEDLLRITIKF